MADEQDGVVVPFRHRERAREPKSNPLIDGGPRDPTPETRRRHGAEGRCYCGDCLVDRYLTKRLYGRGGSRSRTRP